MKQLLSLFSGCGGSDLGFFNAGFTTIFANEYDKSIYPTYFRNFPDVTLNTRSITDIPLNDYPKNVDGIIGSPPCQSWSSAGAKRGINDPRGKLFYNYVDIVNYVQPKFFVAENVHGIISKNNINKFKEILGLFKDYNVEYKLLNANDYGVAQDRKRVIIIGYHKSLNKIPNFPEPLQYKPVMKDVLNNCSLNNDLINDGYSPHFLSRQRVRGFDEPSFTILASSRFIPFHPSSPKMIKDGNVFKFAAGIYSRLSVRNCAAIQSFPDAFEFIYENARNGYKMIGNAVPPKMAQIIAETIKKDLYV